MGLLGLGGGVLSAVLPFCPWACSGDLQGLQNLPDKAFAPWRFPFIERERDEELSYWGSDLNCLPISHHPPIFLTRGLAMAPVSVTPVGTFASLRERAGRGVPRRWGATFILGHSLNQIFFCNSEAFKVESVCAGAGTGGRRGQPEIISRTFRGSALTQSPGCLNFHEIP